MAPATRSRRPRRRRPRFVHCGTEAAILAGEPLVKGDETLPLRPDSPPPTRRPRPRPSSSCATPSADGFEAVVLRPRFVWGAGDTTLLPGIAEAVRAGKFAWIGGGTPPHLDDPRRQRRRGAPARRAEKGRAGEAYFVTDDEDVVFREFVSRDARDAGRGAARRVDPRRRRGASPAAGELAWRLLPLKGEPPLTRFALWVSTQECTLDDSKARSELGYEPVVTREEGLAELRPSPAGSPTGWQCLARLAASSCLRCG